MEMHQVRYFLAVCRTLNFTKAAEECNVAQPSLTRAIQKLEEEFGGLLFHRERANTHLTELGRAMLPHLERTFEAAQSAKQLAAGLKKGEVATLRLGLANTVSSHILTEVLSRVQEGVPKLELTMGSDAEPGLLTNALDGEHDLVVMGHCAEPHERMRTWVLYHEAVCVLMPATHRLAQNQTVSVGDLDSETFILAEACPLSEQFKSTCASSRVNVKFPHSAVRVDQIESLVLAGLGLSLVPASLKVRNGLVTKELQDCNVERAVTLGAVSGRKFSIASDAFVKIARTRNWDEQAKS